MSIISILDCEGCFDCISEDSGTCRYCGGLFCSKCLDDHENNCPKKCLDEVE